MCVAETFKPGEKVPFSGIFEERGPRGGKVPGAPERTVVAGEPFPPSSRPGNAFVPKRKTKH